MRMKRKSAVLMGLVPLFALVCPQLAVPVIESGALACLVSDDCRPDWETDYAEQQPSS